METLNIFFYGYATTEARSHVDRHVPLTADRRYHGALDSLERPDLDELSARPGHQSVPIEQPDGTWIELDYDQLDRHCLETMNRIAADTGDPVLMFCTAPWYRSEAAENVILPFRLLEHVALALRAPEAAIGVIQPVAETADFEIQHWRDLDVPLEARVVSESEPVDALAQAAQELVARGASVIVLDCLNFTESHYEAVRAAVDVHVLLPATLLPAVIGATTR